MRLVAACLWCVMVGCSIESQLVPCGDKVCPRGSTCVAEMICATTEQVEACAGVADGDPCSYAGGSGRCAQGTCVASGCGNGIVEADEPCDDGNQESGDGCRGDCRKVEQCGDAIVDQGEACDDGNANASDGCDACQATVWHATAMIGGNTNAVTVGMSYPAGVAFDRSGNVFVADTGNCRIRRIDATGVITTIAGTGDCGYGGDGGAATSAQLQFPNSIAIDGLGNVYVADSSNHRIRLISPNGVIRTVAGTGAAGSAGDGGQATSAELRNPYGIAVDGLGNMVIGDSGNHRVRAVSTTGIISTIAGTGTAGLSGDNGAATSAQLHSPAGVAIDATGRVLVADVLNHRIRRIDTSGVISTIAGSTGGDSGDGGPATAAQMSSPVDVDVGADGSVYIGDQFNFRVRKVSPNGVISTVAGDGSYGYTGDNGPATAAQTTYPMAVAVDDAGTIVMADERNNVIRRIDPAGVISTIGGDGAMGESGDGFAATCSLLAGPTAVDVDAAGNVYIADAFAYRVRRVGTDGLITTVAGNGNYDNVVDDVLSTVASLSFPTYAVRDAAGNLYITDQDIYRVRRVDAVTGVITTIAGTGNPGFSGDNGPATSAELNDPNGLALDAAGNLFIADTTNHRIRRVTPAGTISTVAGSGTEGLAGDGGQATSANLSSPEDVFVDAAGTLYIADTGNNRIRRVTGGVISTFAGTIEGYGGDGGAATAALLSGPSGVVADANGNVYISDSTNHKIRKVTGGTITTFAGTGTYGFSGDGGPAASAMFAYPQGITVDGAGNLFVADLNYGYVRRIDTSGVITSIAGRADPEGVGPLSLAHLTDPRAFVVAPPFTFVAGGSSGTVLASNATVKSLEVVAGRYPQPSVIGNRARYRGESFGDVNGIAYDAAGSMLFVTETTSHRIQAISLVDPADASTWTIAPLANAAGTAGFLDGAVATARFRSPSGLMFEPTTKRLYVADTGNHVIRVIDLANGIASATVSTVVGVPETRGFFGDGGAARDGLLFSPQAITRCSNGDLFIADTGNHRVRRVEAATGTLTTVLGVGVAASSGEGVPASTFPVNAPRGLACDPAGNLFVTSSTTVRLVTADDAGIVDGTGQAKTIYGAPPRASFPGSVTNCLTGLAVIDATHVQVADSCTGILVELERVLAE